MDTYILSTRLLEPDGDPIVGATVTAVLSVPDYTLTGVVMPVRVTATSDLLGDVSLPLASNLDGTQDSLYEITISARGAQRTSATIQMPRANARLEQLVDVLPITTSYTTAAAISAALAQAAAEDPNVVAVADNLATITTVASNIANVNTVAGISANVTSVAGNSANINTVAGANANITTVASNIADVSAVAGVGAAVSTVAGNTANVNTVATNSAAVTTVSTNIANVNTVAGVSANVTAVASNATNINTVATNVASVSTVAANVADVNTVAGIDAAVSSVAANAANINTVATNEASVNTVAANVVDVNTVAGVSAGITTVATNIVKVGLVSDDIADVNLVADDIEDVTTVAGKMADVTAVAAVANDLSGITAVTADITTVANNIADVSAVATNIANVNTTAGISANVTTVAGISANVTTVAGISANVTTVAGIAADVVAAPTHATTATTQAGIATTQAGIATTQAGIATAASSTASTHATTATNQAAISTAQAAAAAASAAAATAVVVSGDVALIPTASQVPLAYSDGRISPNWVAGSLRPTQFLENITGTTGLILEDDTEFKFVPQMSPEYLVFIPATLTTEIQIHRDGNFGAYIQTDKKLRVNYGGTYTTLSALSVSDDWVNIQFSYNDNEASAVTFDTNINGVAFGSQQVVTYSDEFIRSIWASDYGFLHIASMGYGFLTNAASTKLQNWGDAIGALPAVAGAAVTLAQATSTARPLIGRVPVGGRRNQLRGSANTANSAWLGYSGWTATGDNVTTTTGASNTRQTFSGFTAVSGTTYTVCFDFQKISGSITELFIDIGDGTTVTVNVSGMTTLTRVVRNVVAGGGGQFLDLRSNNGGEFVLSRIQLNTGATELPYQEIGLNIRNITESGIPDQEYAFFDRADDILAGTVSAITSGEIIIAGRNGVWHDSLTVSAGTWQIGATSYTGGPAGILAVIGDFIGAATLSGRAFTTAERDALYALFKERGAPGVFTLGAELVTNGTFDSDTTGWYATGGAALASIAGELRLTSAGDGRANQAITAVTSQQYLYSAIGRRTTATTSRLSVIRGAGGGFAVLSTGSNFGNASNERRSQIFTATGTDIILECFNSGSESFFDNVSLKAITLTPWS